MWRKTSSLKASVPLEGNALGRGYKPPENKHILATNVHLFPFVDKNDKLEK